MPEENPDALPFETVKVKNPGRQSLLVQVPGRSILLQPGESADIPKPYLETPELKALLQQVSVLAVPPAAQQASREGKEEEERKGGEAEGRKERRR